MGQGVPADACAAIQILAQRCLSRSAGTLAIFTRGGRLSAPGARANVPGAQPMRRRNAAAFSSQPILYVQAADVFKLVGIGGDNRGADRMGVRGDQQVAAADRLTGRFQLRADAAIFGVGGHIERQYADLAGQVFDGLEQPFRAAWRRRAARRPR